VRAHSLCRGEIWVDFSSQRSRRLSIFDAFGHKEKALDKNFAVATLPHFYDFTI